MNKLFCISIAALVFASCKNSGNRKLVDPVQSTPTTVTNTPVPPQDSSKPVVVNNPVTNVNPVTPATTNTKSAVALNPDHGAPGHRCDIPVGAPLNSPANTTQLPTTAPATNTAPVVATPMLPQPQPATNKNAKLNPAHGEPGHDCAVPVGQPLKS